MTAWTALVLSLALAALKVWETFFQKPDLGMNFDRLEAANGEAVIWFIVNVGRRRAIIKDVRFQRDSDVGHEGFEWLPAREDKVYPTVLDAYAATPSVVMAGALDGEETAGELRVLIRRREVVRCVVTTVERRKTLQGGNGLLYWTFAIHDGKRLRRQWSTDV